jgi:hypothetical protein
MGNNEHPKMQYKFQNLSNSFMFITTPTVSKASLHPEVANYSEMTLKCWVLMEQH